MNEERELSTQAALVSFKLSGQFLALAGRLVEPAGLSAARWQVLGAVVAGASTVSGVARQMGITRQSVQRTADVLVTDGLLEYQDNPQHKRAKLLVLTTTGRTVLDRIHPQHATASAALAAGMGIADLAVVVELMARLSDVLDGLDNDVPPTLSSS